MNLTVIFYAIDVDGSNFYSKKAEKIRTQLDGINIPWFCQLIEGENKKWIDALWYKVEFIQKCVERFGNVLYIDCDSRLNLPLFKSFYRELRDEKQIFDIGVFTRRTTPKKEAAPTPRETQPYWYDNGHVWLDTPGTQRFLDLYTRFVNSHYSVGCIGPHRLFQWLVDRAKEDPINAKVKVLRPDNGIGVGAPPNNEIPSRAEAYKERGYG